MKNKAFLCAPRRFLIITVVYLLIQSVGIYLFFESLQYEEIGHLEAILNIIAPPAPLWIAAFFRRYDWLSIVRLHEDKIVFPTNCWEVLWAPRQQVTKVAMLGYNFIPSWLKNFVPTWHKVKNVGNRKTRITST